jgi:hypothetical protein
LTILRLEIVRGDVTLEAIAMNLRITSVTAFCFLKHAANRLTSFYAFAITNIKLSPSMLPAAGASRIGGSSFVLISQADSPGNEYSRRLQGS